MPPGVFNSVSQSYSESIFFDAALNPETTLAEKFTISIDNPSVNLTVSDVVYLPQSKTAVITVDSGAIIKTSCITTLGTGLTYLDGTPYESASYGGTLIRTYTCEPFGLSARSIEIYQNEELLSFPITYDEFEIRVTVVNNSDAQLTETLKVYLNNDIETPLVNSSVTVDGNSEKLFKYTLRGKAWDNYDVLNVTVE